MMASAVAMPFDADASARRDKCHMRYAIDITYERLYGAARDIAFCH